MTFSAQVLSNPKLRTDPRTRTFYRSALTLERKRRKALLGH